MAFMKQLYHQMTQEKQGYQMVLSNELDPYRCLLEQLNAKRYDAVELALKE